MSKINDTVWGVGFVLLAQALCIGAGFAAVGLAWVVS